MPELRAPYQSRARVTYLKKERFSIRSKPTCENKEIINKKQFYIDRYRQASSSGPESRFRWIAILNPSTPRSETPLAYLNAERGACNDIYTHKGSKNCGIGRAMLLLCLNDDDVIVNGGYNPLDIIWFLSRKIMTISINDSKLIVQNQYLKIILKISWMKWEISGTFANVSRINYKIAKVCFAISYYGNVHLNNWYSFA